jgi:hypothetical protein
MTDIHNEMDKYSGYSKKAVYLSTKAGIHCPKMAETYMAA